MPEKGTESLLSGIFTLEGTIFLSLVAGWDGELKL
jgi:hypothetical protein